MHGGLRATRREPLLIAQTGIRNDKRAFVCGFLRAYRCETRTGAMLMN